MLLLKIMVFFYWRGRGVSYGEIKGVIGAELITETSFLFSFYFSGFVFSIPYNLPNEPYLNFSDGSSISAISFSRICMDV